MNKEYIPVDKLRKCSRESCDNQTVYRFSQLCDDCIDSLAELFDLIGREE